MLLNYFKIALRNLSRNRVYTIINILGLAIGFSCALIIGLYVVDELSFDSFHNDADKIYRITATLEQDKKIETGLTSIEVGPKLFAENDELVSFCRVMPFNSKAEQITTDQVYYVNNLYFTDSTFFDVFSFNLIEGDLKDQLNKPNTIVISTSLAKLLFDEQNPINKKLKIRNSEYTVTGIIQDPPRNTDIQYSGFLSFNSFPKQYYDIYVEDWFRLSTYTFLKVKDNVPTDFWDAKFQFLIENSIQSFIEENGLSGSISFQATPISQIHFDNSKEYDSPKGNLAYVLIFGFVAVLILIIACINYVNLSLAQFSKRLKEIGVRKTLGANKNDIVIQFLLESFVLSFAAVALSLMFAEWFLPIFSSISGSQYYFSEFFTAKFLLLMLALWFFVAFLGGSYPAMVHSKFMPVDVFRRNYSGFANVGLIRKVLVTVQFTFTIALIAAAFIVYQQIQFIHNSDLGYNKENIMVFELPLDSTKLKNLPKLKQQLINQEGVKSVSLSNNLPNGQLSEILFRIEDKKGSLKEQGVKCFFVDQKYAELLGLTFFEGRNFDPNIDSIGNETFIVNQKAKEVFGWKNTAVGKRIQWGLMANDKAAFDGNVIGVINDFHYTSLHQEIEPLVFIFNKEPYAFVNIKVDGANLKETISAVETKWENTFDIKNPNWKFLDQNLAKMYLAEERTFKILIAFAIFSLLIACLGLFALTSFMVEQKTKEIGIRKILGADYWSTTLLISKGFIWLFLIAVFIAIPVGYFFLDKWLISFAYKININPIWFGVAVIISIILSAISIFYHVFKVSNDNPIKALRYS